MSYLDIAAAFAVWLFVVVLIVSLFWINDEVDEE